MQQEELRLRIRLPHQIHSTVNMNADFERGVDDTSLHKVAAEASSRFVGERDVSVDERNIVLHTDVPSAAEHL